MQIACSYRRESAIVFVIALPSESFLERRRFLISCSRRNGQVSKSLANNPRHRVAADRYGVGRNWQLSREEKQLRPAFVRR